MPDPIAQLRARVTALPPGPHRVEDVGHYEIPEEVPAFIPTLLTRYNGEWDSMSQVTAETVAALIDAAPELLAVAEAAQGLLADADAAVRHAELRASGGQVAGAARMTPAEARAIRRALAGPVRALDAKLDEVTR